MGDLRRSDSEVNCGFKYFLADRYPYDEIGLTLILFIVAFLESFCMHAVKGLAVFFSLLVVVEN